MSDEQRKKSRQLAFKNPMRLADEHAALLEASRLALQSDREVKKKYAADDAITRHDSAFGQLRAAVGKADAP